MKLSKYNLYVEKTKKKSVRPKILNFDADNILLAVSIKS